MPTTIGYPDRWEAFTKRNQAFITQCYPALVDTSARVLNRHVTVRSLADNIIFLLGRTAAEDYWELWLLAGNGYGIGAYKVLRGMYEKVVTAGYLVRHPDEIQRFHDYGFVQRRRLMNRVKKDPNMRTRFTEAEYAAAEEAYQRVKASFDEQRCETCKSSRQLSWTKLDIYSMATKAGYELEKISITAHVIPTSKIHTTVADLAERKISTEDGKFTFDNNPQEQYADSALVTGAALLLIDLLIQDAFFELNLRSEIEQRQVEMANAYSFLTRDNK